MAMKPPTLEKLETLKVDTLVGNLGNQASKQDGSVSKFSSTGNLDMPIEIQISDISKTIRTKEMDQERNFPEKTKSTESKPEQVITKAPSRSAGQSDSEQDTIPEQHTKVFSSGTTLSNVSCDKQKVIDTATSVDSDGLKLQSEHSSPLHITKSDSSVGEAINLGGGTQEDINDPHPNNSDTSFENTSTHDALKKISCDNDFRENKKSTLECHLAPQSSKPAVDKIVLMKDKELRGMQPLMFSRPEEKSSLKHLSSTAGAKGFSFGCQKNSSDLHLRSTTQARSDDTRTGSKSVSDSLPGTNKLMRDRPELRGSKDDLKSCNSARESIVSDVTPSAAKLIGNMQSVHEEVNKSKTILLETAMSTKDVNMLSSQVNPSCLTDKTARNTTQMSVNSKAEVLGKESSQKPRITSVEGNKPSFKAGKTTHALSSLKTLRNIGANTVLATSLHLHAYIFVPSLLGYSMLSNILLNLEGRKMAKLSFCFCSMLLLLSFSMFETRPLQNHDPFSSHFQSSSLFLTNVKYLNPRSENRSLAKVDIKLLAKSRKLSSSTEFRDSNGTSRYYQPLRVSPGGPDAHHHFETGVTGEHGRR